jgi:hypothetical protein
MKMMVLLVRNMSGSGNARLITNGKRRERFQAQLSNDSKLLESRVEKYEYYS